MAEFGNGARVVIADGNPHLCRAVEDSFAEQGKFETALCHSADTLVGTIDGQLIDLLVVDERLPGLDLGDLVRRIRRQELGKNPYVAIIVTIADGASARHAIDAGVDEVMPKPLTVDGLFKQVSNVVQRRRPFVISPHYVGPTRRKTEREEGERVELKTVPNSLRAFLFEMASRREIEQQVSYAAEHLADDQFQMSVREISRLISHIASLNGTGASDTDWRREINRLIIVADSMRAWYAGPSRQVVNDLTDMLSTLAQRIVGTAASQKLVEVDLLVQLNQAVPVSMAVESDEMRHFNEIAKIVNRFTLGNPR